MDKKKILLLTTVSSMVAAAGTVIFANGGLSGLSALATNGEVWHHYAAVAPTETTHGSKEFWASSADGCATHTFTDPGVTCEEHDFSKYDSFDSLSRDDDRYVLCLNESLGITPMFSTENKTVTYGLYPQTVVDDSGLLTALNALDDTYINSDNGWYFYRDAYYAKLTASPYESSYVFNNGDTIVEGTSYWFLCEAITWDILSNNSGEYYLLSDVLLDAHCYHTSKSSRTINDSTVYANNYQYSDIRAWLNGYDGSSYSVSDYSNAGFIDTAFALGSSYIQETTVDNSASTTKSSSNSYACNNTQDKVFLPSYQDYNNTDYGFDASDDRCCRTTDWARARGADYGTISSYLYNGYYWTRSPDRGGAHFASYVYNDGYFTTKSVLTAYFSVRPSLSITIAQFAKQ